MAGNHILHVPLTLDVSSQWLGHIWLMVENSTTVTGTLAHSYFLLPDLGSVCPVQATYEALTFRELFPSCLRRVILIHLPLTLSCAPRY